MFGLILTTKREMATFGAVIQDLRRDNANLQELVVQERKRAEAAINLLLARTASAVITPEPSKKEAQRQEETQEQIMERTLNLFGDQSLTEEEALEKLQS